MYFSELSPYSYNPRFIGQGIFNFGWINKDSILEHGPGSEDWIEQLKLAGTTPVSPTRGYFACEFCAAPAIRLREQRPSLANGFGNGELWIPNSDNRIFAAPILVLHYVTEHNYRPPEEVIEALRALRACRSDWDTPDGRYRQLLEIARY